jgi:hypothetical protein
MLGGPHARSRALARSDGPAAAHGWRACGVRRRTKAAAGSSASFSTSVLPRTATTARFAAGSHTRQTHPARERARERVPRRHAQARCTPPGPKEHRPGHAPPLQSTSAASGTAPGSGPTCHQRRAWVHPALTTPTTGPRTLNKSKQTKTPAEIEIRAFPHTARMARGSLDDAPSAVVYGAVQSRDIEVRRGENLCAGEPACAAL